ncbi:hypothetical protein A2765_02765 [Candidatus Kaiserbacteria bacterium RIFCSPHIGHO2_01_FULL_56_24]|uniref:O-antigen ligase-related domain-containing protein n=1 Tax=Candidatus Kaiserbacteria bacterium RIFCSPHIGHO2_01_FULL_56_24 TaxID=1798487 RepID=A0A1F6DBA4_9BACT|nr:MAG: hypothetical protein A2765_02765 [Candidatus Kaiserbacteria bacterium RIFCSPHIGHO2_01_FULL_56_24]
MLSRVAKALPFLLLAPALVPLLYVDGLLYPYLAPKTLLVRALGILMIAAFAYLALSGRSFYWTRLRERTTWIPGTLLVIAYVTSLFGIDFYHSFWSIFDRGDGLLTLTVLVASFYITLLVADRRFFDRLCNVVAWAGSLVALYATLQWLQATTGMDIPIIAEPRGRFGGTLGNAAFLAAYLGMTLFVTLIATRNYAGTWQRMLYAGAGLQLCAILISATRGTLLALVIVALCAAAYGAWKGSGRTRALARWGLAALVVAAGIFFMFRSQLMHAPFEPVRRLASISVTEGTVSSRLFIWKNIGAEALKRPLTGYGAEHIDVLFNTVYDPVGIDEQWFDRSHNAFLDYFAQYGVLGLALYLALLLAFAHAAWKLMRSDVRIGGPLLLMVLTYAIQNLFVFDTVSTLWILFMFFASLSALQSTEKESVVRVRKFPWLPEAVGVAIVLLLIPVSIQPLRANMLLADGYLYHILDARRAVDSMQKGLALGTYADLEYGYQAYEMYTERQVTMLSGEARVIAYRFAASTLAKDFERYPYDARTATYYAHVLDSAPPEIPIDETALRAAIDTAIKLSPKRMQPRYLLANISLRKGDRVQPGPERNVFYREGIKVMEDYAAVVPGLAEPRFVLATLYLEIGDPASAKKWADEGILLDDTIDSAVARRAARYYITIEDWPNAARFLGITASLQKENYPLQYDLAKAKWLAGDTAGAREIVEKLKIDAPGLFESDPNFVKEYNGDR